MTIDRRTVNVQTSKPPTGAPVPEVNVLHKYRSFNYLFTLAALSSEEVNDPKTYRSRELNYVVLRSGGKGENGIKLTKAMKVGDLAPNGGGGRGTAEFASRDPRRTDISANGATSSGPDYGSDLLSDFNKKSPGRFDMFIDNLEIETIMQRDKNSASTQPTNISFDVYEPYSINGFIEALQVAAQASGHPTYAKAAFVLKMEFIGYPDDEGMPDPVIEPLGIRYFPIQITNVEVNLDEKGTKYQIKAVPLNEVHFGNPSTLKKSVKIKGATVKDIIEDMVRSLSEQVKKEGDDAKEKPADYDEYKVKFPSWDDVKGWVDTPNEIALAKVTEITEDKNLFTMPDPGNKEKIMYKDQQGNTVYLAPSSASTAPPGSTRVVPLEPRDPVIQFNEGRSVQECIEAIIRDSHYLRSRLEKLMGKNWKEVVKDNMFDYFLIKLEVTEKPVIDKVKNKHYYIYTYVITPYKMLYTKVPGFANQTVDQSLLYQACVRKYDYIYTGKNLDITNFKLNFNNLFFEAIPSGMGNVQGQPGRDAVSKTDGTDATRSETNANSTDKGLPASGQQSDANLTNTMQRGGGQPQQSPYYAMAQAMHNAIVNSQVSMIGGNIDILGDPIFLVTGGLGNNNPKPAESSPRVSQEGEAQFTYGDVMVNINFRNPVDIGEDGYYEFDTNLIPFSGVYQVLKCKSTFKDGQFKQSLEIMRMPGQAIPTDNPKDTPQSRKTPITNPADSQSQTPNPDDVATADLGPPTAEQSGFRPGTLNLLSQLNRSIPSPGLPGELSNFTAAAGGAGSTVPVTAVSGINPNLPGVSRMISPLKTQDQPAFGMPLPARAAVGLQQQVYSPGGFVQQAGMNLLKSFGVSGPAAQLANQYLKDVGRKVNSIPVLGSGIGIGASINIAKNNPNPQTVDEIRNQQLPSPPTSIPNIQGLGATALGVLGNNLTAIPGITNNAALRVQAATQGNTADPLAIAAAYGISQAQLSGLSPNITSNLINQLGNLTKKVPADTDLNTAVKNGVNLNGLTQNELGALPPTVPYARAPEATPDVPFLTRLASAGGQSSVARAFGVNSINEVSQTQLPPDAAQTVSDSSPSIIDKYKSRLGIDNVRSVQDAAVLGLKLYGSRQSLMGPTGIPGSLEGNFIGVRNQLGPVNVVGDLGKSAPSVFGSKSSKTSPLDKIMIR